MKIAKPFSYKIMVSTNSKYLALLLLLCVFSGCKTFSRLMSKGGTVYTVEVETSEPNKDEIFERAVKILQNKINAIGADGEVSRIVDKPNQISVKLYATENPERIKKFLFTAYRLELKKADQSFYVMNYPTKESAEQMASSSQEVLPFSEGEDLPIKKYVIVDKQAVINGDDLRDAQAYKNSDAADDYKIMFTLKPESAAKFGDWTGKNIGQYIAIVLDNKVISAPVIKGQIFDNGVIEGRFTKQSAEDLALSLKSGYLPATMNLLDEKQFK